jgi:hypothetical protein
MQSLAVQHHTTLLQFSVLNLKGFFEVEHLVPNQIPRAIGIYENLSFVSDCY